MCDFTENIVYLKTRLKNVSRLKFDLSKKKSRVPTEP
jgi:hypothetical protein